MWLMCVVPDGEDPDWKSLLLRFRLDQVLPEEISLHLIDQGIQDVEQCASLADEFTLNQRLLKKGREGHDT